MLQLVLELVLELVLRLGSQLVLELVLRLGSQLVLRLGLGLARVRVRGLFVNPNRWPTLTLLRVDRYMLFQQTFDHRHLL